MLLVLLHSEVASGPGDVVGHQRGKEDLNKNVTNLLTQLSVASPTSHLHARYLYLQAMFLSLNGFS